MANKNSKPQICRLCHKLTQLRKSHILPEFFYQTIYDNKHRTIFDSSEKSSKMHYQQKGIREYLLCEDCEQQFSKYETMVAPIIKLIPELVNQGKDHFLVIPHVDYKIFKLFQMSLLWRASISKHIMFTEVKLDENEEILRKMLLDETPGEPNEFACMMVVQRNSKMIKGFIMSPAKDYISETPCFRFQTGAMFWYFIQNASSLEQSFILTSKENFLKVYVAPWPEDAVVYNIAKLVTKKYKPM